MIKGKELRLGNLVKDRGEKVIRIDFLEHIQDGYDTKFGQLILLEGKEVHPMTEHSDYALPIPITNDWLIRLGFKLYSSGYYCLDVFGEKVYISISLKYDKKPNLILDSGENALSYDLKHIRFVHELQNVFYYLTGTELQVVS